MTGLQGLISQMESDVERKLWKICKTVKMYEGVAEKSMSMMTHIYNSNRRAIVNRYMSEVRFVEGVEGLARNLTALRKRSASLAQKIKELSSSVRKQVAELYRTEVDIDMNLRSCRGSCRSVLPFSVDHRSYQMIHDDMDFMEKNHKQKSRIAPPPAVIPQIKLQAARAGPRTSAGYKTIPTVQRELLTQFEDIGQNQLVLDELMEESEDVNALSDLEMELE